ARAASKSTREGENVGVLLPNIVPTVGMIIGLSAVGRVPAMLNYTAGTEGMQNACTAAALKTLFTSRKFLEVAKLEEQVSALQGMKVLYIEDFKSALSLLDRLWIMALLVAP
ncbi:MAG TPA: hypothetical protein VLN59_12700, partial [Burkholderiales bacterium]|nr:hypothetical protein [Burkholderiales bacterium]